MTEILRVGNLGSIYTLARRAQSTVYRTCRACIAVMGRNGGVRLSRIDALIFFGCRDRAMESVQFHLFVRGR